ncbi:m7G(5')pppN diphosphatase [Aureococcus anophagefferens]|nr:m7G(5')pppN diphosphatase [Aureococcus anophagefferens]
MAKGARRWVRRAAVSIVRKSRAAWSWLRRQNKLPAPPPPPLLRGPTLRGEADALARHSLSDFVLDEVLACQGGTHCRLLGSFRGEAALVTLDLRAPLPDGAALASALPEMRAALSGWSGAEYSFYAATLRAAPAPQYALQIHCPASEDAVCARAARRHARRAPRPTRRVEPYVRRLPPATWIDRVCALEAERVLFAGGPGRASSSSTASGGRTRVHAPRGSAGRVARRALDGRALPAGHLRDPALRSIRDLRGAGAAAVVSAMRAALVAAARDVYGVPEGQLRLFFHYCPRFWRLHAHAARVDGPASCAADRAHLVVHVEDNLRRDPAYYRDATLSYRLREGDRLHAVLDAPA